MDSDGPFLRTFEVPESLDWQGVLRTPDTQDVDRLSAADAEDPGGWTESDVSTALRLITDITASGLTDCLDVLTTDGFIAAFNLIRYFPNLEKKQQIYLCQTLSILCKKVHSILEKVPVVPYSSTSAAVGNPEYLDLEKKLMSCANDFDNSRPKNEYEELLINPRYIGLVLRSMVHVCVFLTSTCYRFAVTSPKDVADKKTLGLDLSQAKKPRKGKGPKKQDDSSGTNPVAIELLVDSMAVVTQMNLNVPFSGDYGGNDRPSSPMLRLLLQTLLNILALEHVVHQFSEKVTTTISRVMKINFSVMQSRQMLAGTPRERPVLAEGDEDAECAEGGDVKSEGAQPTETEDAIKTDDEWLMMVIDDIKKAHCVLIADSLAFIKETPVPNVLMNELLLSVKENFLLQATSSSQLNSSAVQSEFSNIGLFIERVAKKVPAVCLSNLMELRQLFDIPSYALRKSIMESIKMLIVISKSGGGDGNEMGEKADYMQTTANMCAKQRENLLNVILARQLDTYMYARAHVLKILQDLIEEDALPVRMYNSCCTTALSRLMDKGAQVRQRALGLITTIVHDVTSNKFLLTLDAKKLTRSLDTINNKLSKIDFLTAATLSNALDKLSNHEGEMPVKVNCAPPPTFNKDDVEKELKQDLGGILSDEALGSLHDKLDLAREMYSDALEIALKVEISVDFARRMLRSPFETDQRAAVKYIATCHLLGVTGASKILSQVWELSWANNQNVVDAVMNEFKNVYFSSDDNNVIATRLIKLVGSSNLTCLASIEKIFEVNMDRETPYFTNLDKLITSLLTIAVAPNKQLGRDSVPRTALGIIRLILWSSRKGKTPQCIALRSFDKNASVIRNMLQLSIKLTGPLFGEICLILNNVAQSSVIEELAEFAMKLFLETFGSMDGYWFRVCQSVVDLTFIHCKSAEVSWTKSIISLLNTIFNGASLRHVSQFIFLCGHVAVRTVISLDKLQSDLKGVRANLESVEGVCVEKDASNNMGIASRDEREREIFERLMDNHIVNSNLLGGPPLRIMLACLEDPLLFITGGKDGDYNWLVENLNAKDSMKEDLLEKIEEELNLLKTVAAISLCKYATVSKKFCGMIFTEESKCTILQLIISLLLNKRIDPSVDENSLKKKYYYLKEPVPTTLRSTLLMCYGDLLCRHPNLLEPWNDQVFQVLLDADDHVRETAVLVFTHLVMNDMIKPKGKLLDGMMFLTLDKNAKISECAKTFFHEIHKKNANTIYNCFPEMIATLAMNKRNQSVSRNIKVLNMLLAFLQKDKQHESIVEKICIRLQSTAPTNKMAICIYITVLLKINYDEKCLTKLTRSLSLLRHLILECDPLLAAICVICKRIKSSSSAKKTDSSAPGSSTDRSETGEGSSGPQEAGNVKSIADELMNKITELFGQTTHVNEVSSKADDIIAGLYIDDGNADNLYIHNFGYVTADDNQALSDYEEEKYIANIKPEVVKGDTDTTVLTGVKSEPGSEGKPIVTTTDNDSVKHNKRKISIIQEPEPKR